MRRYVVFAPGEFESNAKTAHGVIRYSNDQTVAVVDPTCARRTVREVVPYLDSDAPVVASVAEALHYKPGALLVNVSRGIASAAIGAPDPEGSRDLGERLAEAARSWSGKLPVLP